MAGHVIHISEAEAIAGFAELLHRVREGSEVVIEDGDRAIAVIRPSDEFPRRTISESLALAEEYEKKLGYTPVMDEEFAADMREIIQARKPLRAVEWD